jgi:hypothetical protein
MSSENTSPTLEEMRSLYEAAIRFQALQPWIWLEDSDLFGVQDPVSGEVGYCCIMGMAGEHFALAVYLGSEGLAGYLELATGQVPRDPVAVLATQKCLMASFEDRGQLSKADLQTIRDLGLKFRGRHAWPQFRSYRPGYEPWYLTRGEALFLTLALEQAIDVAARCKEEPDLLTPARPGLFLVRVPERRADGWEWHDAWRAPDPRRPSAVEGPPIDEERLQKVRETAARVRDTWEADVFYFPQAVKDKEDERPYYPQAIFCVDQRSGLVLMMELVREDLLAATLVEQFLQLLERLRQAPREVQVRRQEAYDLLAPAASRLGIRLKTVRRLKAADAMREMLFTRFG